MQMGYYMRCGKTRLRSKKRKPDSIVFPYSEYFAAQYFCVFSSAFHFQGINFCQVFCGFFIHNCTQILHICQQYTLCSFTSILRNTHTQARALTLNRYAQTDCLHICTILPLHVMHESASYCQSTAGERERERALFEVLCKYYGNPL